MASYSATERRQDSGGTSLLYDPRVRGIFYQVIVFGVVIGAIYWIVGNTVTNLQRANIASGFGFLSGRAGFDISQTLIQYSSDSNYGRAFLVGLMNTLYVAALGVVTASIIGFLVGIGRLSRNWLIRKICTVYVEVFRNIPPLLVIFFWYFGVLSVLPQARDSIALPLGTYMNNRGFFMPAPVWGEGAWLLPVALLIGIVASIVIARWAKRRQMATGQPFHTIRVAAALIIG
ncbi:MAG TPA: ABC transporter permease subunit, partial [Ochrobactrum intermedium]